LEAKFGIQLVQKVNREANNRLTKQSLLQTQSSSVDTTNSGGG
jgi:hypothetical protein